MKRSNIFTCSVPSIQEIKRHIQITTAIRDKTSYRPHKTINKIDTMQSMTKNTLINFYYCNF